MSSELSIEVSNLTKCYQVYAQPGDRLKQMVVPKLYRLLGRQPRQYYREFWALKGVSFAVAKGESVGILGRNGSGKSTLLQIIAGTLAPTEGNAVVRGRLTALLELGSGFNPEFSGRDNVYLNGVILGLTKEEIDSRFDEIAQFADIGEHIDRPVKTYSSGMVVRLAFAVQACVDPQILIVDEALSVGDEKFQRKCFDHIERLRSNGCSVLLVTHSTATVEKFCQRGILLHQGEVRAVGAAKDVVDEYHALLYADERAVRDIGINTSSSKKEKRRRQLGNGVLTKNIPATSAQIDHWEVLDDKGQGCSTFRTGDWVRLRCTVIAHRDVSELQAGVLLRTVEGVSVFGTSTMYWDKNPRDVAAGECYTFEFRLKLELVGGSYFVTFAIAEAISEADMRYLDRKADAVILKVIQPRVRGTGVCLLPVQIDISRQEV